MAGVTLGFLKYVLGFDSIAFRKGMTEADRDLVKLQKSFEKKGQQFQDLGTKLSAFVTLPLAGLAAKGIKEAQETAKAMAQVDAALKSTGGAAGVTAQQLQSAADSFELSSLYEGDQILSDVSARLLAFGNITGATFNRAQQAILDYSTRTGKDLGASTVLIGKALNDPAKAMGALSKAGIQLSTDQQALIASFLKVGDTAGAQGVVLDALEGKFKGAAQAAQDVDPFNKLNDAFNQMAERVGTALLPLIAPLTDAIVGVLNAFTSLPAPVQSTILVVAGLAAAVGPLLIAFGSIVKIVATIGPAVTALSAAWGIFKTAMIAARVAALATLPALAPFLIPLAAIAAAVGVAYLAWKNWDKIAPIVQKMVAGVISFLKLLATPFNWVVGKLKVVGDAFFKLYDRVVGHSYIPDMVDGIEAELARLDKVLVQPAVAATGKAGQAFKGLQTDVKALLDRLYPERAQEMALLKDLRTLEEAARRGLVSLELLADARSRLYNLQDAPIGVVQGSESAPDTMPIDWDAVDRLANSTMPKIVDQTQQWRETIGQIGAQVMPRLIDDLLRVADGSMKLKDVWKDLLAMGLQMFANAFAPGGGGFGGFRASGGPVLNGKAYVVGERGPELFVPPSSGKIISHDSSRRMVGGNAGRGWSGDMIVYANDADSFRRNESQIRRQARRRLGV